MKTVLIVSNDLVGTSMAGPGIRYYHFARELAKRFDVTLMVPYETDVAIDGVEIVPVSTPSFRRFKRLAQGFDVIVAQRLGARAMRYLARTDTRTIYDLYVPFMMENLGFYAGQDGARARALEYEAANRAQEIALATGDAFVCASEKQRDLWLGVLSALGRVNLDEYAEDPTLASLISIVPFGLEEAPPRATRRVLKGVVPGIRETDRVLLWGGGIWNWFDPLTLIRAVARLAPARDDVKLYFLGVRHPNPVIEEMAMTNAAVALAKELDVYERSVFFNFGWVPYEERQNFLLEADLGVSTHLDNVETRFAFRTRLLDYFWALLPTVTTRGDVLSDLVARRNLGRAVDYGDVEGLAAAIEELLDDEDERRAIRENLHSVRDEFAWPRVVAPLAELAARPGGQIRASRNVGGMVAGYFSVLVRNSLLQRGVTGVVADTLRFTRAPRVP